MQTLQDTSVADWLQIDVRDPDRLITTGPPRFEAYARLRYAEAEESSDGEPPTDIKLVRSIANILAGFTTTPERCYYAIWDGYLGSFLKPEFARASRFQLPHREYILFSGRLAALSQWEHRFGDGGPAPAPAFLWPEDHAWCFTSDVDSDWAVVGATREAVDALASRHHRIVPITYGQDDGA